MTRKFRLSDSEARDYVNLKVDNRGVEYHRRTWEGGWLKHCAFYNGKHAFRLDGITLVQPNLPPHRVLYKADFISGAVATAVAKIMAARVEFSAPPMDGTRDARNRSRISKRLFDYLREATDWDWLQEITWTWAAVCGSGFQQILWDPLAGPVDRFYLQDKKSKKVRLDVGPDERKELELSGKFEDRPQGEIQVLNWNPFQTHWDTRARERGIADAQWVATRSLVDIDVLEDYWGYEKVKDVEPIDIDAQGTYFEEMLAFMATTSPTMQGASYAVPKDKRNQQTMLTQFYERPGARNGNYGRLLVVAGDTLLHNGDNPYRILEKDVPGASIPFLKYDWQVRVGSFVGIGLVERLTSPQFQYNRARATTTEHQNIYGHPAQFVPKNSDIPTGHMSIQPGVVYEYTARPGVKPVETGPVPVLPKEVSENSSRALSEIQMISSQSDPDMSKLPGQIRGAPAMSLMIEEKNKVLLPTSKRQIRNTIMAGRLMLAMGKNFYTGSRILRYVGDDGAMRIQSFLASDIQSDIRVVGDPKHFYSSSSERASILEYVQVGVLNPAINPDDRVAVLKALAFGTADEAIAERLADEENQEYEIEEMVRNTDRYFGVGPSGPSGGMPTQPFDDDAAHLRVLRRYLKSPESRRLAPLQKQLLIAHLQEHQMKLQAQIQQQMALVQAQRGTPGEKGTPSQPRARAEQ